MSLAPVASLRNLKKLELYAATNLTLAPLRALRGLVELTVTGTAISFAGLGNYTVHLVDPTTIGGLRGLKKLGLAWVDVRDVDFLIGLEGLEDLHINQTRSLIDIRALATLQTPRSVQLVATSVVDISPLLNLRNLKTLIVQVTPARLDVITQLKNNGVTVRD
jgi:hypothetical protein